jgi:hypothetical protein
MIDLLAWSAYPFVGLMTAGAWYVPTGRWWWRIVAFWPVVWLYLLLVTLGGLMERGGR